MKHQNQLYLMDLFNPFTGCSSEIPSSEALWCDVILQTSVLWYRKFHLWKNVILQNCLTSVLEWNKISLKLYFKKNPKEPKLNKHAQQNQKTQTTQAKNEVAFLCINLFKIFVWIINGFKAPQYMFFMCFNFCHVLLCSSCARVSPLFWCHFQDDQGSLIN